jgi:hypothetical protein
VSQLQRIAQLGDQILVWGDAQIIVFDGNLNELARFGNNVKAMIELDYSAAFAVEDDDGLHSLLLSSDTQTYAFNLVDGGACGLDSYGGSFGWVSVHSPCSDPHLVAEGIDAVDSTDIEILPFKVQGDSLSAKIEGVPIPTTDSLLSAVSA